MLSTKTILGAGWLVSSRMGGRLIDVVTVLVLARILTPADFGLTALAMTLISVADTVLEVPLFQALIRLGRVDKSHLDTAFTIGIIRALVLWLVVLGVAWPFSIVFQDGRLFTLVAILAIGPVSRSLNSPAMVTYVRQMSFRPAFTSEFVGKVFASAMAIVVVYLGGGYWAIATSSVLSSLATAVITYILAPYRPAFSLTNARDFTTFLGWYSSAQLVSAVSWQFDRALLGYFVTKTELGQYSMATDLAVLPTQSMVGPAMVPVMAAFSRIKEDHRRLRQAYLKASRFTMLIAVPACVGMSLTADLIVHVLLGGARWNDAAVYLQWLALSAALTAYYNPLSALSLALDKPVILFRLNALELFLRVVLISIGLYLYSLMGVIAARGLVSLIMFFATLAAARNLAQLNAVAELLNLWKVAAACAVMAVCVLVARQELADALVPALELGLVAAGGAASYVGTLFVLGARWNDIKKPVE